MPSRPRRTACLAHALFAPLLSLAFAAHGAGEIGLGDVLGLALRTNADTLLRQQQVIFAEGQVLQARGQFDPVIGASAGRFRDVRPLRADEIGVFRRLGLDPGSKQTENSTVYRVGADKQLLNGISAGAGFSVASTEDSLQTVVGIPSQLSGTLAFTLRVPMARNAGRETVGAALDASQAEYEAVRAELHQGNAQTVLDTTIAYWDWVAAEKRLAIAVAAERRLNDLVKEMRRLIDAGQMPKADIELALASRAEKTALRITAEQTVDETRRGLVRLMGLPPEEARAIGRPANDFPAYRELPAGTRDPDLVDRALSARADLEAARLREQAARYRLTAANNNLKPQVDLNLSVGYTGLSEGTSPIRADQSLNNAAGPSVGASLTLQWPWENSAARGTQTSAAATYDATTIRQRDLGQNIATSVPVTVAALRRAAAQSLEGAEAVRRYETALKNEQTKRRLGNATVIDVINVEDRLNAALLTDVAFRQTYATAIAQLRFELGSLVRRQGEQYQVAVGALLGGNALED